MIYYFGSAFNPLTLAHQKIIADIASSLTTGDNLIVGVTTHEYKDYEYSRDFRYELIYNYMFNTYPMYTSKFHWQVWNQYERTWKFLNTVFKPEDQKNICLIIGQDEYDSLLKGEWHFHQEILNTYKIKIIPRTDNISSTAVRNLLKQNATWEELSPFISKETYNKIKQYI